MNTETGTIIFDNISKRYRIGTLGTLRGALSTWLSRKREETDSSRILWALNKVSFKVEPGGALGLIGPNGAGKTTTLRILSNITRPTSGRVLLHGRFSSLIELGAGFHPELTGRENIYLNGAILGLKQQEIKHKLDAIIAFSELERFIDTPVKRYSSGMYVRLAFAVAAHVEPEILLVDEVLAVGDAGFRHRCVQRMRELRQAGTTLVFVSHNMHLLRNMCDTALLLMQGEVVARGKVDAVISKYEELLLAPPSPSAKQGSEGVAPSLLDSQGGLILTKIEVVPANVKTERARLASSLPTTVKIHYQTASPQPIGRVDVRIIREEDGTLCNTADSSQAAAGELGLCELCGKGIIAVQYQPLQLTSGVYRVIVRITDPSDSVVMASGQSSPFTVYAVGSGAARGIYVPLVEWKKYGADKPAG